MAATAATVIKMRVILTNMRILCAPASQPAKQRTVVNSDAPKMKLSEESYKRRSGICLRRGHPDTWTPSSFTFAFATITNLI